jgi:hypothetical protein
MSSKPRTGQFLVKVTRQFGSMFDFAPSKAAPRQSAGEALRGDWVRVGGDLKRAIRKARGDGRAAGR